jgi:NADPH2:quinone reductase
VSGKRREAVGGAGVLDGVGEGWPQLFLNTTIRLLGSDDFPPDAKRRAAHDLTTCLRERRLGIQIGRTLPLEQIATAHQAVEQGRK